MKKKSHKITLILKQTGCDLLVADGNSGSVSRVELTCPGVNSEQLILQYIEFMSLHVIQLTSLCPVLGFKVHINGELKCPEII